MQTVSCSTAAAATTAAAAAAVACADAPTLRSGEANLGTTIMAVKYNGGVVMGADSRTTSGSYISNRVTDKITYIHDRIFCCRSGSAADTQAVADMVEHYCRMYAVERGAQPAVKVVASLFQEICYENKDSLMAGIIVAGWDDVTGPSVYSIPLGGSLHAQDFAIGGSGSTYIYGYCDAAHKPNMTRDEAINFVTNALALAMSRDGSSGGCIRLKIITKNSVDGIFIPGNELPRFYEG